MRKAAFLILLILSFHSPVFALEDLYLGPYGGSINVNLNNTNAKWNKGAWGGQDQKGAPFEDGQIVAVGALYRLEYRAFRGHEARDYGLRVTFFSNSNENGYFWFTSQSNPDSRRPFYLNVAGQVRKHILGDNHNNEFENWGLYPKESTASIADSIEIYADVGGWALDISIIPDIAIVLPGEIVNGVLTIPSDQSVSGREEKYSIVSASDYSCDITVRYEIIDKSGNVVTHIDGYNGPYSQEITIPFSGFYDPLIAPTEEDNSIPPELSSALSVHTYPAAANIDLRNDQGTSMHIADISYAVYNVKERTDSNYYDDSIYIFLSASPNPYSQDINGFRFVHEDVAPGVNPSARQSLGYTVTVNGDQDTVAHGGTDEASFNGDEYLSVEGSVGKVAPDNDAKIITGCYTEDVSHTAAENIHRHWHSFNGEIWLNLDVNREAPVMEAGYYHSNVYVHAIVDEAAAVL